MLESALIWALELSRLSKRLLLLAQRATAPPPLPGFEIQLPIQQVHAPRPEEASGSTVVGGRDSSTCSITSDQAAAAKPGAPRRRSPLSARQEFCDRRTWRLAVAKPRPRPSPRPRTTWAAER